MEKYRSGYLDCIQEVKRFLTLPETGPSTTDSKFRHLLKHLDNCLSEINAEIDVSQVCVMQTQSSNDNTPLDFSKTGQNLTKNGKSKLLQDENKNRNKAKTTTSVEKRKPGKSFLPNEFKKAQKLKSDFQGVSITKT